jgi:hypothetical protein
VRAEDVVLGIEQHDPQLLLLQRCHLDFRQIRDIIR